MLPPGFRLLSYLFKYNDCALLSMLCTFMLEGCLPNALLSQAFLGYNLYSKDGVCTAGNVHHVSLQCIQVVLRGSVN